MQTEENRYRNRIGELQRRLDYLRQSAPDEGTVTITVLDGKEHPAAPAGH